MGDGRRHSVDIPISRTLVALRRVRSLRDPCTNSMSKFSALLENVNWETNSTNEISLRFENGGGRDGFSGLKDLGLSGQRKEQCADIGLKSDIGNCKSNFIVGSGEKEGDVSTEKNVATMDNCCFKQENTNESNSFTAQNNTKDRVRQLDLMCITPSSDRLEDVDSMNELVGGSPPGERPGESIGQCMPRRKPRRKYQFKSSGVVGDVLSRVGSPCLSTSDALSSYSTSLLMNEEADFAVQNDIRCGLSCCWSRTPKFRESNPYSDGEGNPLLSKDVAGRRSWKNTPNDTPRSLSYKFKPKSFEELVGQRVVARSLLGAISTGRIASLYLFYGPRGTGKTSASRIFAAALNCLSMEEYKPCGLCRECVLYFTGRSRDVREVDSVSINHAERIRSLIKNAATPPLSSRFKVFIVDECHLLHGETWATLLNSLENFSPNVIFVMITADLDKLPRTAMSRSQRYHFPKIKDNDIASRLGNICVEEGLEFDQVALEFIASKSNGSLRDAKMMLDQLSLLGRRITMSLAYELIGVVSDDELLDLLDLALSSDTSSTVIRARELMRSRIDPMQLVSQLANLIMDILAGKYSEHSSEVRRKFSRKHASEADLHRLSHALKILSEAEKQLRMSKNQSTWLTVALLQLSSLELSSSDAVDSKSFQRNPYDRDGDFCSTPSTGESLKHLVCSTCQDKSLKLQTQGDCRATLDSIWKKTTELCQSKSLHNFLRKHGKLSSLRVSQDLAVAELVFHNPHYASKAEKSWKLIASSLQLILGCNVEIRIHLVLSNSVSRCAKLRKLSFMLFGCSRRIQKSQSRMECGNESDNSDHISEMPMMGDKALLPYNNDCESQLALNCYHRMEVVRALRNREGNVLSMGTTSSHRSLPDDASKTPGFGVHPSKEEGNKVDYGAFSSPSTKNHPNCFHRTLRIQKKSHSSDGSRMACTGNQQENQLALSNHPCAFSNDSYTQNFGIDDGVKENSGALCWRTPTFPLNKAWQPKDHQQHRSALVGWVLPCAATK